MAAAPRSPTPTPADRVLARVRAVADPRAEVEAYGSSVYAPAHASDVDVLVVGDEPARLAAALGFEVLPTTPPRLHGELEGAAVDVSVVNGDDALAQRMRAGPRDAAALAAHLRDHARDEAFQAAWPHVRQFVRSRALGHNGLGWFGSFGWALLLAAPLATDPALRAAPVGAVVPAWLRWLARLPAGVRVALDGTRPDDAPLFLAAPAPPLRDVARLSRRAAAVLVGEAAAAVRAIADAATDAEAVARIEDVADAPPSGATLVITFEDERGRGRYDGTARGLLGELERLGAVRSWGRFDDAGDGAWQHRISVPPNRRREARAIIERFLAETRIDAALA